MRSTHLSKPLAHTPARTHARTHAATYRALHGTAAGEGGGGLLLLRSLRRTLCWGARGAPARLDSATSKSK